MKHLSHIYYLVLILAFFGCGEGQMPQALLTADSLMQKEPRTAYDMLRNMEDDMSRENEAVRMRHLMLLTDAQNKAFIPLTSDSAAQVLVDYYSRHGSKNDRIRAYYLLGRSYCDMGEAPQALQAFYNAIEQADTTRQDCDLRLLGVVYGQMSTIFHKQNLPHDEIQALRKYIDYIARTEDEADAVIAKGQLIRPYALLEEDDSVLQIIEDKYHELMRLGKPQDATASLGTAIFYYVKRGQLEKARQLKEIFEKQSGLFDEHDNVTAPQREGYYFTRGNYEIATHQMDAAERDFRRAIRYGYLSEGYKGLLHIYRERGVADSVARFSILFEQAQDSLHKRMRTDAIHQMKSLYDYSRSERLAEQRAAEAREARAWTFVIVIVALIVVGLIVGYFRRSQAKKRREIHRLNRALTTAKAEHDTVHEELSRLKAKDYEGLIAEKERREQELRQTIEALQQQEAMLATDRPGDFADSQIVQLFRKKSEQKTERPIPSEKEWHLLEQQFRQDMPAMYERFCSGRKLSTLEQRTCIMLLLGYPEGTIVKMTEKSPQSINTAKARANEKLFGLRDAHTLKFNLLRL